MLPPMLSERKFRNERNGVLPPPLDVEGLGVGVGRVGLPLTDGYRDGGTKPRVGEDSEPGKEVDVERVLITGIWEALCVSAMSNTGPSLVGV